MPKHPDTLAVTAGRAHGAGDALNPAITPSSTYRAGGEWVYGRDGNPAWDALEGAIGALEGGFAVSFSSGMAAVAAVLATVPPGGVVVAPTTAYHGVIALISDLARSQQLSVRTFDFCEPDGTAEVLAGAALVWVESPTNPMIDVVDLAVLIDQAHRQGAVVAVDSTLATPMLQQPLALGADFVVHSATKFIGGHSDLLLGVVACDELRAAALRERRHDVGSTPGALESFLALRGLRTLPVRLERAQESAQLLSERLLSHAAVTRVRYPGLPGHPQHDVARRQMSGFGSMVSFETVGEAADTEGMAEGMELIVHGTSLGGVETLIERRARYDGDARQGVPPT
ncbi:MAG: PLP-dependent transferase, partial [Candidatus Nanopelagicales bacterium]